ncbi:MAG: hypothetical protein PHT99_06095, partial [Methanoregula sp.]|nr:hypothetical protein [Methanoregula sp.]
IFILGMLALLQWVHIRDRREDLVPALSPPQIAREILWSGVFPALSVAGFVLALLQVPYSIAIYIFAPFIMAYLFWKNPIDG